MSIQAVASVLESDVGDVAAKMLLVCIANSHNSSTGVCCPSLDRLAKESSMSRSSVKRWLKWLVDEGFIEITENHDKSGRQQSNNYRIIATTSSRSKLAPLPSGEPGEGFTSEPDEGSNCEPPLKEPEEYRKKEREGARATLVDEFERYIWNEFPQNPGSNKSRAMTAYLGLSQPDRISCIRGVARYSLRFDEANTDEPLDQRLKFQQHLSNWIADRGWEAELASA